MCVDQVIMLPRKRKPRLGRDAIGTASIWKRSYMLDPARDVVSYSYRWRVKSRSRKKKQIKYTDTTVAWRSCS